MKEFVKNLPKAFQASPADPGREAPEADFHQSRGVNLIIPSLVK